MTISHQFYTLRSKRCLASGRQMLLLKTMHLSSAIRSSPGPCGSCVSCVIGVEVSGQLGRGSERIGANTSAAESRNIRSKMEL